MPNPILDLLAAEPDPVLRRRIKAQALAAMADMIGASIDRGAFRVTLTALDYLAADDVLRIRVRVNRISNGNNVTPALLNPILVIEPPILVDDPAGDIVRTWTDRAGVVQTRRMREDLRECIRDAVRRAIAQHLP